MRQVGRKSAAQLAIVTLPGQRHPPPKTLTKAQADIWRAVIATKPATWFTVDSHPLLTAFCRHVATADALATDINTIEAGGDDADYKTLLALRDKETSAIIKLAQSMRLTQLSRLKAETAATQSDNTGDSAKPWQQNG